MDVDAIHQGFLRGFRQGGGMLRTGSGVARAERTGARWRLTLEDGSTLSAATVVNAAGAWADTVAQVFGVAPVGIVPMRRSAFTFDAGAGQDSTAWPALVAIDESWYIKPGHGQLLGSPANADPTTPHDVVPEEIDIATGIWRIEEATTLTIRRPTSTWAGLRSFVPDGELVIGFDDAVPGFFWLAGQGGYGIQSAAGASALADALLRDAPLPEALRQHGVDPAASAPARLR
jgi:D-arginine dehydrogenase